MKGLLLLMLDRVKMIFRNVYLRNKHPHVKFNGRNQILLSTEIIQKEQGIIALGENIMTKKRVSLASIGGQLTVDDNVFFNRNNIIVCHKKISIGKNCSFGPNVVIYDHDHKFGIQGIEVGEYNTSPIIIEENCWIGANVTILRGTHIGSCCVIGAGSIVKGEIPPHSLVTSDRKMIITPIKK